MGFDNRWIAKTLTQISANWYSWQAWLISMHCSQETFHFLSVSNGPTSMLSDIVITLRKSYEIIFERYSWKTSNTCERCFWGVTEKTSFLRYTQHVSKISHKRRLLCEIFETCWVYLKKDVFSVTPQKHLSQVFEVFQEYLSKIISYDFRRVITISDNIDVGPLETLKKWNVSWEQCIDINQACHEYQLADICVRVLAIQRLSKPNSRCIIYYFQWLFSTDKTIHNPLLLWTVLKYRNLGEVR